MKLKSKTPNALPPTILNLEPLMGVSLTLKGARQVDQIDYIKIGSERKIENGIRYPYYLLDLSKHGPNGSTLARSKPIYSLKKLKKTHRSVHRKLAVFLFDNKDVQLCQ